MENSRQIVKMLPVPGESNPSVEMKNGTLSKEEVEDQSDEKTGVPVANTVGNSLLFGKRAILKWLLLVLLLVPAFVYGVCYGHQMYSHFTNHEETDDAYVRGHLHQVSSRLQGTVEQVLVDDNEHVRKGQIIVVLDSRDFEVKVQRAIADLEQAKRRAKAAETSVFFQETIALGEDTEARGSVNDAVASVARAEANVREAKAGIEKAKADLEARKAEVDRATVDYKRYIMLEKQGAVTKRERDAVKRDYLVSLAERKAATNSIRQAAERFEQAKESVAAGKAALTKAQAQIQLAKASSVQTKVLAHQFETNEAAILAAKAALSEAELNLSYTKIVAPTSGRVGKKTVEEGHRVEPGQPLLTIVSDDPWVVANYKETQLKNMHAGQKVEIKIDSLPGHTFEGKIESFSPASGASFALLPSDNATGNFTKIVQRVPVKILFDPSSTAHFEERIVPGMSVITSVDTRVKEIVHRVARSGK